MLFDMKMSRRGFLLGALVTTTALAGCASTGTTVAPPEPKTNYALMYGPETDGGFEIPAVPWQQIGTEYLRQRVKDPTGEPPGTLVVDTTNRFLYLVEDNGTAMRYGVGVGRAGFSWGGEGVIQWKQEWPKWFPPQEMIARDPELKKYSEKNGGMEAGLMNPLGARALYIYENGKDTLYRVHGNPEWNSIGKAVSSGCIRMLNQDIIDLYNRVPAGSRIIVKQPPASTMQVSAPVAPQPPANQTIADITRG
ncbi:L,D-transpeptidase [Martelella alba]|uniref:L,D-transpeptidase n=1 Tax=Martelella alba TaxID=2590451 RepID=A0A506U8J4_9HYPH|nr:L,D-transpeptidase [Martelella alba]TPW29818.1 L,D-transpeptidase [Martelella alba]